MHMLLDGMAVALEEFGMGGNGVEGKFGMGEKHGGGFRMGENGMGEKNSGWDYFINLSESDYPVK